MKSPNLQSFVANSRKTETAEPAISTEPPRRDRRDQWLRLLPSALLIAFVVVLGLLFGERLLPAHPVEVSTVVALRLDASPESASESTSVPSAAQYDGAPAFQASGWIEADPYPQRAVALVDGIVREVGVLEGERVVAGQVIARLVDEDQRLLLAEAQARLQQTESQVELHQSDVALRAAELNRLLAEIRVSEARLAEVQDTADRMHTLANGAVPEQEVAQALLRLDTQRAQVEVLRARIAELEQLQRQAALRVEMTQASLAEARARVDQRSLALDRTRILAPVDGIVQRLNAYPGRKVMAGADNMESLTLAVIYDPASLQARIDVPLEEAAQLHIGQLARVRSNLLPNQIFRGRVTRIVGESDLQRNTLQAKVELLESDPRMRPEMLCRVEFLASRPGTAAQSGSSGAAEAIALFLPSSALVDRKETSAQLFRLSPDRKRVERVNLSFREDSEEPGMVRALGGVNPGDIIVLRPDPTLETGARIRVQKEEDRHESSI